MDTKNNTKSTLININDKYAITAVGTESLNKESLELINQIIAESDLEKSKDLTYLFNVNQNKKTMVRINKLSDLLDTMTQQALIRFTNKPDEISNKELMDGLKIVQDIIERGQKQVEGVDQTPLIQINQQTNSVNIGSDGETSLNRESRERVKNTVLSLLKNLDKTNNQTVEADFIDISGQEEDITEDE